MGSIILQINPILVSICTPIIIVLKIKQPLDRFPIILRIILNKNYCLSITIFKINHNNTLIIHRINLSKKNNLMIINKICLN